MALKPNQPNNPEKQKACSKRQAKQVNETESFKYLVFEAKENIKSQVSLTCV